MKLIEILSSILDLLYPRNCIITDLPVNNVSFNYLSSEGLKKISIITPTSCKTCGHPFDGEVEYKRQCPKCHLLKPEFNEGRTIFRMDDAGKHFIHTIKYHQGHYLISDVEKLAASAPGFAEFIKDSILIPVPLHSLKLRERGFNQSLEIAKAFKNASSGISVRDVLIRQKDTPSQTSLNRENRIKNMKNAFILKKNISLNPAIRYIVVDDVFTTGATLNDCCKTLKNAGVKNIDIVTLVHG